MLQFIVALSLKRLEESDFAVLPGCVVAVFSLKKMEPIAGDESPLPSLTTLVRIRVKTDAILAG